MLNIISFLSQNSVMSLSILGDILDGIKAIANFFISVGKFITTLMSDLVYAVGLITETVATLPTYFTWLPGSLTAVIITTFSVVVIYKILGRD